MDEEAARKQLTSEGFAQIYVHTDGASFEYAEHEHPIYTTHIILEGGMIIWQGGKEIVLNPGDRFDVPKQTLHAAKMGPEGCTYMTAIRI